MEKDVSIIHTYAFIKPLFKMCLFETKMSARGESQYLLAAV